ncbi:MAG: YigZ family protein [Bifidobacteriaceae bacterium]|nr:YigZ family protein [Bifidobacteriaceae bacterium]
MARETETKRGTTADGWLVVAGPAEAETVISKSRFVATVVPCETVDAATEAVARRRRIHYTARHHCTALVIGPRGEVQRSSDDGEPAGTAGVPMLEVLRRRHVTDVAAIVTRYFGGVLLGAGGLIRAYSGAVASALDCAVLERLAERETWAVAADFTRAGRAENAVRRWAAGRDASVSVEFGPNGGTVRVRLAPEDGPVLEALAASLGLAARCEGTSTVRVRA